MTFVIYHLSALVTANKDRELEDFRVDSQVRIAHAEARIAAAQAEAAEVVKVAESERLAQSVAIFLDVKQCIW